MVTKKTKYGINFSLISLTIFFLVLSVSSCMMVNIPLKPALAPLEETVIEGTGKNKILLLDVTGVISTKEESAALGPSLPSVVARIREELKKAAKDIDISGVIVRIDSPGGTVTASDIIYHELTQFKKERNIPVYAIIMNIGASGGYYVSLSADRIFAHPTSITGSIGVIAIQFNISGLLEKIGVEEKTAKSGELKDIFSPFRPDTPEEEKIIKSIIANLHERFVDAVAEGREGVLSKDDARRLADGRPYTAEQALELKLIDKTGYLDDAIKEMKHKLNISDARIVSYIRPGGYKGSIYSHSDISPSAGGILSLEANQLMELSGVRFMYLWAP